MRSRVSSSSSPTGSRAISRARSTRSMAALTCSVRSGTGMSETEARQAGSRAVEALEPEAGLLPLLDPLGLVRVWTQVAVGLARHPLETALAARRYAAG